MSVQMGEPRFRIWSDWHKCWWRPNNSGYTRYRAEAGLYTQEEIYTKRDRPVPADDPWDPCEESRLATRIAETVAAPLRARIVELDAEVARLRAALEAAGVPAEVVNRIVEEV